MHTLLAVVIALVGVVACRSGVGARSVCRVDETSQPSAVSQLVQRRQHTAIVDAAFSPSGRYGASLALDGTVAIWDVSARSLVAMWAWPDVVNGEALAWLDESRLWVQLHVEDENEMTYIVSVADGLRTAEHDPTWNVLVDGGAGGNILMPGGSYQVDDITVHDPHGEQTATITAAGLELDPEAAAASAGKLFAVDFATGRVLRWLLTTPTLPPIEVGRISDRSRPRLLARGDSVVVVETAKRGELAVQRLGGGPQTVVTLGDDEDVRSLALSPDGKRVAIGSTDATTMIDVDHGRVLWRHVAGVVAFSPDATAALLGDLDGGVKPIDVETARSFGAMGATPSRPIHLRFDGADRLVVTYLAGAVPRVRVWSLKDGVGEPAVTAPGLRGIAVRADHGLELLSEQAIPSCASGMRPRLERWLHGKRVSVRTGAHCLDRDHDLGQAVAVDEEVYVLGRDEHARWILRDVLTGRVVSRATHDPRCPRRADPVLSDDGRRVSAFEDGKYCSWDARTGKLVSASVLADVAALYDRPKHDHFFGSADASYSYDHAHATVAFDTDATAACSFEQGIRVVEMARGRVRRSLTTSVGGNKCTGLREHAVSPRGEALLLLRGVGDLELYRESVSKPQLLGRGFAAVGTSAKDAMDDAPSGSAIVIGPSGDIAATMHVDGAVRIWDLKAATLRATLLDFDDEEWMIAVPSGHYIGTDEVGDRVGWVFGSPLEHFGFEQFAARFRDRERTVRILRGEAPPPVSLHRPPTIRIEPMSVTPGKARVRLLAQASGALERVRIFVEGRQVVDHVVCKPRCDLEFDVPLLAGPNQLSAVAFDTRGFASNAARVTVVDSRPRRSSKLWLVAVGIDHYPKLPAAMQLQAARADAEAIVTAFRSERGRLFQSVNAEILGDREATPAAIRAAIDGLSRMGPDDVAVVFLAGHGIKLASGEMAFVTSGIELPASGVDPKPAVLQANALRWADITAGLARARGRVLVLLDACHSGHVHRERFVRNESLAAALAVAGRAGTMVFAASKGRQQSFEPARARGFLSPDRAREVRSDEARPHGFFTGALLATLEDASSDVDRDGVLELSELVAAVTRRVTTASGGLQTPWVAHTEFFGDFALATAP